MNRPQNKTILLVDDDPIANLISVKIIEMSSTVNVVTATDARKALNMLERWSLMSDHPFPEVIFLDINMPIMDGWEFLIEFQKFPKSMLEKCKIFMLSSSIDPYDVQKAKMYTCIREFISKPLTLEKFELLNTQIIFNNNS